MEVLISVGVLLVRLWDGRGGRLGWTKVKLKVVLRGSRPETIAGSHRTDEFPSCVEGCRAVPVTQRATSRAN